LSKRIGDVATVTRTTVSSWTTWLDENQGRALKDPLPARAIGEVFVFLCEQYRQGVIEKSEKAIVQAFLYALGTQELAWRRLVEDRTAMPERLAGEYSRVTVPDLDELFNRVAKETERGAGETEVAPHLAIWRRCPAFANSGAMAELSAIGNIKGPDISR
jgi:hypothetical protein